MSWFFDGLTGGILPPTPLCLSLSLSLSLTHTHTHTHTHWAVKLFTDWMAVLNRQCQVSCDRGTKHSLHTSISLFCLCFKGNSRRGFSFPLCALREADEPTGSESKIHLSIYLFCADCKCGVASATSQTDLQSERKQKPHCSWILKTFRGLLEMV